MASDARFESNKRKHMFRVANNTMNDHNRITMLTLWAKLEQILCVVLWARKKKMVEAMEKKTDCDEANTQ